MSRSHAEADWFIMYTAPAVSEARKHMMVITTVSDRPVTEPAGTIGALVRLRAALRVRPWLSLPLGAVRPGRCACGRRGAPVCGPS